MTTDACIVLCTCPDEATAERVATGLVGERLAACVNVLPGIRSVYRWQGQVEQADEVQLIIKTRSSRWAALEQFVRQVHPYDTPELIALPVSGGLPAYLDWLERACE